MANTITVDIVADVKGIKSGVDQVNSQLGGLTGSFGKVGSALKTTFGAGAAIMGGGALVGVVTDVIGSASDLNETISKTQTIFGAASPDILKFGDNAAKSLGLSKNEALGAVSTFGNFFDQIGIGTAQSAELSKGFVTMSADLASFHNAAPVDVMEALSSATRGEYDALQKYIPTINAAAVEQKALAMTHKDSAKELTAQDKALALNQLAMEGMGAAAGDLERTSGSLANQQRSLTAQWDDAKAAIGTALLPMVTKLITWISTDGIPMIKEFAKWFKEELWPALQQVGNIISTVVWPVLKQLLEFIGNNLGLVTTLAAGFGALSLAMKFDDALKAAGSIGQLINNIKIVQVATKAWTIIQAAFNLVMSLNPIALVVIAIAAFVAAIIYAWNNVDGFKEAIMAAWNWIKDAGIAVWNFIKDALSAIWDGIKAAGEAVWNAIKSFFEGLWNGIKAVAVAIFDGIKAYFEFVFNVYKTIIVTVWNWIKDFLSGLWNGIKDVASTVWNAIKSAIETAINAVKTVVSNVLETIKNVWNTAWNWLKDTVASIWEGIKTGVTNAINAVRDIVGGIKDKIMGVVSGAGQWLLDTGKNIVEGLWNGIKGMANWLKDKIFGWAGDIIDGVKDFFGINSPSRVFRGIGDYLVQGLAQGINKNDAAAQAAKALGDDVIKAFGDPSLSISANTDGFSGSGGGRAGGNTYQITVEAPVGSNPSEIGRTIIEYVNEFETVGGTGWRK